MDTLGPRIMVNVGTQAVSTTGLNPRDLAPLTNDAFLATFLGKPVLPTTSGVSRQNNNYRQSYTTQTERGTLRSKTRPSTSNGGDSMEPDSAILSIIRGNGTESQPQSTSQRSSQGNRYRRRSLNQQQLLGNGYNDIPCSPNYRPNHDLSRRRRTRSGGAQQQITVVDQMAAQPHIPYAILPKRFEPKQVLNNGQTQATRSNNNANNNTNANGGRRRRRRSAAAGNGVPSRRNQRQQDYYDDQWEDDEEDLWLEPMPPMMRRRLVRRPNRNYPPSAGYYGPRGMPRLDDYYDGYAYGPLPRAGPNALRSRRRMMYQDDGYLPFDIVPSYDLNEWQGPYARPRPSHGAPQSRGGPRYGRDDNGFIRDDHRMNGPARQSRYGKPLTPTRGGKQGKSPKTKGGNNQQKRRNSRQRKTRNQNSKTEGTPLTSSSELKSTTEQETTKEEKEKTSCDEHEQKPLPQRDHENKENQQSEQKSEGQQN